MSETKNEVPIIRLRKGATTIIELDLSEFDFRGGNIVFTMKDISTGDKLKELSFVQKGKYSIIFEDEFTSNLKTNHMYLYDIMHHVGNERYLQCMPTLITVSYCVGGYTGV